MNRINIIYLYLYLYKLNWPNNIFLLLFKYFNNDDVSLISLILLKVNYFKFRHFQQSGYLLYHFDYCCYYYNHFH